MHTFIKLHTHRYYRLTHTKGDTGVTITESHDPYMIAHLMYGIPCGEDVPAAYRPLAAEMVNNTAEELREGQTVPCDGESVAFRHSQIPPRGSGEYYRFLNTLSMPHIGESGQCEVTPIMLHSALIRILENSDY